jgi:hypothetical protein
MKKVSLKLNKWFASELGNKDKLKLIDYDYAKDIYRYVNGAFLGRPANGRCTNDHNSVFYLKNGYLHRTEGPAYISSNNIEWYINGVRIREFSNRPEVSEEELGLMLLKLSKLI